MHLQPVTTYKYLESYCSCMCSLFSITPVAYVRPLAPFRTGRSIQQQHNSISIPRPELKLKLPAKCSSVALSLHDCPKLSTVVREWSGVGGACERKQGHTVLPHARSLLFSVPHVHPLDWSSCSHIASHPTSINHAVSISQTSRSKVCEPSHSVRRQTIRYLTSPSLLSTLFLHRPRWRSRPASTA